jgi:GNAT superfamily N-acetyltransferase
VDHLFATRDLAAVPVGLGDLARLQVLHERCHEFIRLVFQRDVGKSEALEFLEDLPPGKTAADKICLGLEDGRGQLVGAIDLVRDYPEPGEWFLGLLMLEPSWRGAGAGGRVMDALEAWVARAGATALQLAVHEANTAGKRFWERHGFRTFREATRDYGRLYVQRKVLDQP